MTANTDKLMVVVLYTCPSFSRYHSLMHCSDFRHCVPFVCIFISHLITIGVGLSSDMHNNIKVLSVFIPPALSASIWLVYISIVSAVIYGDICMQDIIHVFTTVSRLSCCQLPLWNGKVINRVFFCIKS